MTGHEERTVAVVSGTDWLERARAALAAGARAIVLDRPDARISVDDLDAARALAVPVVVHRPGLPRRELDDAVLQALAGVRMLQVEASVPQASPRAAVADALGWLRMLSRGPLQPVALRRTSTGALGSFESADAGPITCGIILGEGSWLRAEAIGARRVRVAVEAAQLTIETDDEAGTLRLPRDWEDSGRRARSAAAEAVRIGVSPRDLALLADDLRLADRLLGAQHPTINRSDDQDSQPGIP